MLPYGRVATVCDSVPFGHEGHNHVAIPGRSRAWSSWSNAGVQKTSVIQDETGPRGQSRNRNCTHVKTETRIIPYSYQTEPLYAGYWVDDVLWHRLHYENKVVYFDPPADGSLWSHLDSSKVARWYNESISDATDQIPTSLSLANNLLEIQDLGRLANTVSKLRGFGFESVKDLKDSLGQVAGRKQLLSRVTEYGADVHLAYQFGVKPLLKDLWAGLDIVQIVQKRIDYLRRSYGKVIPYKRTKKFTISANAPNGWQQGSPWYKWLPEEGTTVLAMGMDIVPTLTGLDDASRQLAAYAAGVGLNKPFRALYDAIPFSFLGDYVSNVSALFNQLKTFEPFAGEITVLDGWSSSKTTTKASLEIAEPQTTGQLPFVTQAIAYLWQCTVYTRSRGIPSNIGIVFDTKLSGAQAANVAALVRQSLS